MSSSATLLFFNISLMLLSGCATLGSLETASPPKKLKINAMFVQDTLSGKNIGFRKINRMSPLKHGDLLIAGNALDGLVAYSTETWNEVWRLPISFGVEAPAVTIKDRLFVGSNNGRMYSVGMSDGKIHWEFDTKSELVAEPLLSDGILYFISGNQSLYALDASSGKQIWVYNRQDTTSQMTIRGGSKPSLSHGVVYAGFSDGSLVAINAATGSQQWEILLNRNSRFKDIDASPVVDGDLIFVNSYDDRIYCLSKSDGSLLWSQPTGGSGTPLVDKEKIYVSSSNGQLIALSKETGEKIWQYESKKGILTDPQTYEDLIVVGESQGDILFINAETGRALGGFEPGRGVFSKPTRVGDMFYFVSGEGNLYGVRAFYDTKSSVYYLRK